MPEAEFQAERCKRRTSVIEQFCQFIQMGSGFFETFWSQEFASPISFCKFVSRTNLAGQETLLLILPCSFSFSIALYQLGSSV